ncbi:MAG: Holliday junction resolvase RuvX [Abditibacteriota bacterium]|nr:Holliday junction resolvase RuvX [Abditibacteriota bacterium]
MKRLLSLDIGDARIGIAVCLNPLGIVSPHSVLVRTRSVKADVRQIEAIVREHRIEKVIIGLPSGPDSEQAVKNSGLAQRLMRRSGFPPCQYWNEDFTSQDAEEELKALGRSRQKRRQVIDRSAAVLILESYIRCEEQ